MRRSGKTRWAGFLFGLACAAATGTRAQSPEYTFHIPAEPVDQALVDFAIQAHLSVGHSGVAFRNARANAVSGTFRSDEALRRLLAGTGYSFTFLDPWTVAIHPAAASPAAQPQPAPLATEQVVVTATKRREVAQTIPASIAVISGRELDDTRTRTPNELTTQVAGLLATNLGPGQDKLFVRGLSDSVLPGQSESIVGLYLDEARITDDAPDPDLRLVDIDRVEVVRGPQGTLYGAGSLAGLVRIITNKPDFDDREFAAETSVANTKTGAPSYGVDMMVNQPLVAGKLALRLVGYVQHDGGYIDELRFNLPNANSTFTEGGRAALSWRPNAIWTVTAGLTYQDIRERDSQYFTEGSAALVRDNFVLEPTSNRFFEANVTVTASLNWADLVYASAVTVRKLHSKYDATSAWSDLTGFATGASAFNDGRDVTSVTQEFRLASNGNTRWQWLAGAFYSHRDEDFGSDLTGPDATGSLLDAESERRTDHADEYALFGEATYRPWPKISITAGARVFEASHSVGADALSTIPGASFAFASSTSQHGVTPKLVLAYRPVRPVTVYASVSEGYRLGGFNINGPAGAMAGDDGSGGSTFESDFLWNYEIGAKTEFWGGRLVANAAGYLAVWRNVQSDQVRSDGTFYIVNAGTVNDLGLEADVSLIPLDNLTLRANLFLNNAQLNHPNPLLVQTEGVLPGAPDISFGVSGRYDIPLRKWGSAFIGADYSFVGRSHLGFDESNSPPMGGYHLTNLRLGLTHGSWEFTAFADNLANNQKNTFAFGNPFDFATSRQVTPPRPRTIGVSLSWFD
ncbi:MAG: TonB-dependent receptor domain-containing protein [Rhizomicrobium sp.]